MSNQRKNSRRSKLNRSKVHRSKLLGMITLGVGLVFVGFAALMSWPRTDVEASNSVANKPLTVPVEVDYGAPELSLFGVDGQEHSLADFQGQVVLVNLWATWCPPCKAEMPTLEAFYKAHQGDGFVTIAINDGDPDSAVETFVQDYELTFQVWLDPTYIATEKAFKTQNLPSSFVIDRNGQIRLRWVGEIDRDTLEKYVTPLFFE